MRKFQQNAVFERNPLRSHATDVVKIDDVCSAAMIIRFELGQMLIQFRAADANKHLFPVFKIESLILILCFAIQDVQHANVTVFVIHLQNHVVILVGGNALHRFVHAAVKLFFCIGFQQIINCIDTKRFQRVVGG